MSESTKSIRDVLCAATGQESISEAIKWIAEGHPLEPRQDKRAVLRALTDHGGGASARKARERITREVVHSNFDPAAVPFPDDDFRSPADIRRSLDVLAAESPTGRLIGLTPASVMRAQMEDAGVIRTLCTIAGITPSCLSDLAGEDLPETDDPRWTISQVAAALSVIDPIVEGKNQTSLQSATPLRALQLMFGEEGWEAVERMRCGGVPYETFLTERVCLVGLT